MKTFILLSATLMFFITPMLVFYGTHGTIKLNSLTVKKSTISVRPAAVVVKP